MTSKVFAKPGTPTKRQCPLQKSADGLISLQWYKEGKIDKIVEYCQQDVKVTRDLFEYGEKHGYIKYKTRSGVAKDLKVDWKVDKLV